MRIAEKARVLPEPTYGVYVGIYMYIYALYVGIYGLLERSFELGLGLKLDLGLESKLELGLGL